MVIQPRILQPFHSVFLFAAGLVLAGCSSVQGIKSDLAAALTPSQQQQTAEPVQLNPAPVPMREVVPAEKKPTLRVQASPPAPILMAKRPEPAVQPQPLPEAKTPVTPAAKPVAKKTSKKASRTVRRKAKLAARPAKDKQKDEMNVNLGTNKECTTFCALPMRQPPATTAP